MEKDFKNRLIALFNGLSVPKIAEEMDVNYHTLTNWVTGRTDFPPSELAKIARLTGGNLTWLLTGEGEKHIRTSNHKNLDETFREIIREIVREEIANERRKPVFPIDVKNKEKKEKAA